MSLTGPDILRIACGDASDSEVPFRQGDPVHAEFELLRTTWEAVQRLGARSPEEEAVTSVQRDAEAVGARDPAGPDPNVVKAILSEARAMSALTEVSSQLPEQRPSNEAIMSVLEMARLAGESSESELVPVRAAIEETEVPEEGTPAYAEYQILKQALDATEKLPAASPRVETVLSVESVAAAMHAAETEKAAALMRAALGEEGVSNEARVEVDALRSMLDATERVSRPSPSDASVAAVLAEAKRHGRVPAGMLPAKDRPSALSAAFVSASRFAWQRWTGVAVLVLASSIALLVTRPWTSFGSGEVQLTSVEQRESEDVASVSEELATETSNEADDSERPEVTGTRTDSDVAPAEIVAGPQVAAAEPPRPEFVDPAPVEAQPDLAAATPPPAGEGLAAVEHAAAVDDPAETDARTAPGRDVSWEAGDDVRALSLRLQTLRERNEGLEWGGPTVALGAEDETAETDADPGVQAVGVGAVRVRGEENLETTPIE